jgi:hypothetical protein
VQKQLLADPLLGGLRKRRNFLDSFLENVGHTH